MFPVTVSECTSIIAGLKTFGAGPCAIPVRIVIHAKHVLARPMMHFLSN